MHRLIYCALALICFESAASSKETKETSPIPISVGNGKLAMHVPGDWVRKQPSVRIIEHEFSAPAAAEDKVNGRLTIMSAGGSVKANIDRWVGQFSQPDGKSTKDVAQIKEMDVGGQKIHYVDLSGTYNDRRGPFAPAVKREGYRMLGAIIKTNGGQYFLKFYGPKKTVSAHEKAFQQMVQSVKVK